MEITISLLAYGEAENLKVLLPDVIDTVKEITTSYEIRIIDGMESQDNTEIVCKKFNVEYVNQEEPYYGGAYRTAIKYACGRYFVLMDADGSHDPHDIKRLYEKIREGYDVVIASRYVRGAKTQDSLIHVLMSKFLNLVYRICLGFKQKDISHSYRILKTEQLKAVKLECKNYDTTEEVLFKLKLKFPEIRIAEIPIVFGKRREGMSKRNILQFIGGYMKSLLWFTFLRVCNRIRIKRD